MAGAANRDVNLNVTATEETAPAFDAVDRNIDKTQRKVDGFNTKKPTAEVVRFTSAFTKSAKDGDSALTTLKAAIDDTETHIKKLRSEFSTPGSNGVQLFGDLKSAQRDLTTLKNAFGSIVGDIGNDGAQAGTSFVQKFGTEAVKLGDVAGPVGIGLGVALAAAAAPVVISALFAAVSAGIGGGIIAAGALIEKSNPELAAQFAGLKTDIGNELKDAAQPLVGSFSTALDTIGSDFKDAKPELTGLFASVAPAVDKIAHGLDTVVIDALPGLTKVGHAFSDALDNPQVVSSLHAADEAFDNLFTTIGDNPQVIAVGFETIGKTLEFVANTTAALDAGVGHIINGFDDATKSVSKFFRGDQRDAATQLQDPVSSLSLLFPKMAQAERDAAKAAAEATPPTRAFGISLQTMGVVALGTDPAVTAAGKSVAEFGEHSGASDPAVQAIGKSMTSMGEHAGTAALATQAVGFAVTSLGEHAGTSDPAVQAVGKSMQSMGEHAGTSNLATQALGFSVQSMGEHSGTAADQTQGYGQAVQSLGEHSGAMIGQLEGADDAIHGSGVDAQTAAAAFLDLAAAESKSSEQALAMAGDQLAVSQSTADFTQSLKDNGKTFDLNTQAGRNNQGALLDALGPLQKQYQAQVDAGTATFDTTQKYDAQVDKLIDLAEKNGLAKSTAEDLRKQLEKVQGTYTATVNLQVHAAESLQAATLIAHTSGHNAFFGDGEYLDPGFAFGPNSAAGGGRAQWSMPPVQIESTANVRSQLLLDGRIVADTVDRARAATRHAQKVGAL